MKEQTQYPNRYKFPRTPHLLFSLGRGRDDLVLSDCSQFVDREIVVTLKLDGENTTLHRDFIHARSIDGRHHPSRSWVQNLHAEIARDIPDGWRICGENCYARHAIAYENLPTYFFVFGIYDDRNFCLSWDQTKEWADLLGLVMVPVLYRGVWDEQRVAGCYTGTSPYGEQEGYVVRLAAGFHYSEHQRSVAKMVRAGHVNGGCHWTSQQVVPNKLSTGTRAENA